jgi:UDP-GlcNAc3NAcA epimerase
MSDVFFEEMHIPQPDYHLEINSLTHGAMTGRMLEKIEEVILKESPDWVLVYGDTNSTLAGALAASKMHIKLAHVEAGLRSFNMKMPEEVNRILTDRISNVLFCPTDTAVENLLGEGFEKLDCVIKKVGDVMQDAAIFYTDKSKKPDFFIPPSFVLVTVHRAENTNSKEKLSAIIDALNAINKITPIILPLHPRTKNYIKEYGLKPDFIIIPPIGYLEMVYLLKECSLVMTDSGGLQKEAFFFEKPCITLREETEWVELVSHGINDLCAPQSKEKIIASFKEMSNRVCDFNVDFYGKGQAAKKIIENLLSL